MYFFLASLAALETCCSSTIAPLTLASTLSAGEPSSPWLAAVPRCSSSSWAALTAPAAVMAYDRFVAICHPLRYSLRMSWQRCARLALGSLVLGFILYMADCAHLPLPFCGSKEISVFYCEVLPITGSLCGHRVHEATLFVVSIANPHPPLPADHPVLCLHRGRHPEDPLCRGGSRPLPPAPPT